MKQLKIVCFKNTSEILISDNVTSDLSGHYCWFKYGIKSKRL